MDLRVARSPISSAGHSAHQINHGNFPALPEKGEDSDFYLVPAEAPEAIAQTVVDLVKTRLPRKFSVDSVRDIRCCVK